MHSKTSRIRRHLFSAVLPAVWVGIASGVVASGLVCLFKWAAAHAVSLSHGLFAFLRENPVFLIPAPLLLFGVAFFLSRIYRKEPDLRGGGIPASLGSLRGFYHLSWWKNLLGTFFLSLVSFLFAVPLGTEGPSVQMGCAAGSGVVALLPSKLRAWDRYAMTGGACSGFCVATGAPLSGILFAIEEAHQRISPLIVLVTVVSVLFADLTSTVLSPIFGIEKNLFSVPALPKITLSQLWIPLVVGLVLGLFAVGFLRLYEWVDVFLRRWKRLPAFTGMFAVLLFTLLVGMFWEKPISTGHHLIQELFLQSPSVLFLLLILILRSFLTVSANCSGITGGVFLPLLAIGATLASLLAQGYAALSGGEEFGGMILVLGICGSIAGMMKMPLTAIFFAVEALGCSENLLPVILTATVSYLIPEICGKISTNELILERRARETQRGEARRGEIRVRVKAGSFAVGKEVRDIFWPRGVFILSVQGSSQGDSLLRAGDSLQIRYSTWNATELLRELTAITGDTEISL